MAKKRRGGKESFNIPEDVKKRIVVYDDKSKFFNKETNYLLFFIVWFVGFFAIMVWYKIF